MKTTSKKKTTSKINPRHCPCAHKQKRRHFHAKMIVHWRSTHATGHIPLCGIFFYFKLKKGKGVDTLDIDNIGGKRYAECSHKDGRNFWSSVNFFPEHIWSSYYKFRIFFKKSHRWEISAKSTSSGIVLCGNKCEIWQNAFTAGSARKRNSVPPRHRRHRLSTGYHLW